MKFILLLLIICSSHLGYSQESVKNDSTIRTSKTIIELEDAKTIFKEKKNDWWDKYSNGIIAALTVFVSLGISIWQARSSQKHMKANIISEARVEWIQKLRPHMAALISDISTITLEFQNIKDKKLPSIEANAELEKLKPFFYRISENFNQVKLYLNRDEPEHKDFIDVVENFMYNFDKIDDVSIVEDDLIHKAQIVLKDAWEDAKGTKAKK